MSKHLLLTVIALSIGAILPAQAQSPLQTAKSSGAFSLDSGNFVQVNLAQTSFSLGFARSSFNPNALSGRKRYDWNLGTQLSLKPASNGNSATLYNQGQNDLSVGGSVQVTAGLAHLLSTRRDEKEIHANNVKVDALNTLVTNATKSVKDATAALDKAVTDHATAADIATATTNLATAHRELIAAKAALAAAERQPLFSGPGGMDYDSLNLKAGYLHDQYALAMEAVGIGSKVKNQIFDGISGSLSYQAQFNSSRSGPILFAVSVGEQTTNNSDSLTSSQVEKQLVSPVNGTTIVKTTSALFGNYHQSSGFDFDVDLIIKPKKWDKNERIGLDLLLHSDYASTNGRPSPGLAIFLSPKGQPLQVQGAVEVLFNSTTNKAELNLVAGYHF